MTNKFKIGDSVKISELCSDIKKYPWTHSLPMKIIGISEFYYFTDYWHHDRDLSKIDEYHDGITEECLEFTLSHIRKLKLKNLRDV